jgi:hypothetical protein
MNDVSLQTPEVAEAGAADAARTAAFERKQKRKEQPGNHYTPEELRLMANRLGPLAILEAEPEIMRLD